MLLNAGLALSLIFVLITGNSATAASPSHTQKKSKSKIGKNLDLRNYDHLDPLNLIPDRPLQRAVEYFETNKASIKNKNYMVVIDYSKRSGLERFFLVQMATGHVEPLVVAHGKGSDSDHDGYAEKFSNENGSRATSLGFFYTDATYYGENGYSLILDGLSPSNSSARERFIVIHGADYVSRNNEKQGRSWGCPALEVSVVRTVIDKIKGGALVYAWAGQ